MVRPRIFENLKNTSITIDAMLLKELRKKGVNISEVCREALTKTLNDPIKMKKHTHDKFSKISDYSIELVKDMMKANPSNIAGCIKMIKRRDGVVLAEVEFLSWYKEINKK